MPKPNVRMLHDELMRHELPRRRKALLLLLLLLLEDAKKEHVPFSCAARDPASLHYLYRRHYLVAAAFEKAASSLEWETLTKHPLPLRLFEKDHPSYCIN